MSEMSGEYTDPGSREFARATGFYSKAILWMGIILIFLNLYANGGWSYIWSAMTTGGQ